MSVLKLNLIYILILINYFYVSSSKYPLFKDIEKSEKNKINSIIIKSKEEYFEYILNNVFVISLIYFTPFEDNSEIIIKYDKLSSYKIINKWIFLKIICEEPNDICQLFEKYDKSYPLVKIHIKSIEIKTFKLLLDFELPQLLEFLLKYSTNSIIEIKDNNNIKDFFDKYGDFSPLVIYDSQNTEFISCINMLAKKKYNQYFYFGTIPIQINKEKKEKIIFYKETIPMSYTWERECDDIDFFLSKNIYPLINKVDKPLIYQLYNIPKILVILIGNISKNNKINNFIINYYQKISYSNRNLVFSYIDSNEDKNLINKYDIHIENDNDIKIMIYNFIDKTYYIHPITFNIKSQNEEEIYNYISDICRDLSLFSFTTGSLIKDIIKKLGLDKINIYDKNQIVTICCTIILILILYYFFLHNNSDTSKTKSKKD